MYVDIDQSYSSSMTIHPGIIFLHLDSLRISKSPNTSKTLLKQQYFPFISYVFLNLHHLSMIFHPRIIFSPSCFSSHLQTPPKLLKLQYFPFISYVFLNLHHLSMIFQSLITFTLLSFHISIQLQTALQTAIFSFI